MNTGNLFDLGGRSVLVVGAGGIGAQIAHGLADHGAKVHVADRSPEALTSVTEEVAGAEGHQLDITDNADVARVADELNDVSAIVLTAATNVRKRLLDYTDDDFDRVVTLNLRGSFNVIRQFGRVMVEQGEGSIILFSSIRAQVVEPGQSVYAATKAGVNQLAKTAAAEFGPSGVRVNVIAPGVVETPLTAQIRSNPEWNDAYANKSALQRWARPEELIGAAVYLASDASTFVTGSVLTVDGGWTAIDGRFTPPA